MAAQKRRRLTAATVLDTTPLRRGKTASLDKRAAAEKATVIAEVLTNVDLTAASSGLPGLDKDEACVQDAAAKVLRAANTPGGLDSLYSIVATYRPGVIAPGGMTAEEKTKASVIATAMLDIGDQAEAATSPDSASVEKLAKRVLRDVKGNTRVLDTLYSVVAAKRPELVATGTSTPPNPEVNSEEVDTGDDSDVVHMAQARPSEAVLPVITNEKNMPNNVKSYKNALKRAKNLLAAVDSGDLKFTSPKVQSELTAMVREAGSDPVIVKIAKRVSASKGSKKEFVESLNSLKRGIQAKFNLLMEGMGMDKTVPSNWMQDQQNSVVSKKKKAAENDIGEDESGKEAGVMDGEPPEDDEINLLDGKDDHEEPDGDESDGNDEDDDGDDSEIFGPTDSKDEDDDGDDDEQDGDEDDDEQDGDEDDDDDDLNIDMGQGEGVSEDDDESEPSVDDVMDGPEGVDLALADAGDSHLRGASTEKVARKSTKSPSRVRVAARADNELDSLFGVSDKEMDAVRRANVD